MWPLPGEGLDRVLAAETAVEDLYLAALAEWVPSVRAAALPTFHAAVTAAVGDELPVDVAAVEAESGWGPVAETIVVAGVGVLFAAAVVEALKGIGSPFALPLLAGFPALQRLFPQESAGKPLVAPPSGDRSGVGDLGKQSDGRAPDDRDSPVILPIRPVSGVNPQESAGKPQVASRDDLVFGIVNRAAPELDAEQLRQAVRLVDETPSLAAARDNVVDAQRRATARIPAVVSRKVEMAVRDTSPDDTGQVTLSAQRAAAATVLDPAGDTMTDLAADSWHESAAVQNRAVLAVAELDEDRDELQKIWIATLDGKTRPTHWAADGARVALNAPFIVGGEPLQYPADPAGSPGETYSCRCRMGILAVDEPLPDEVDRHTERLDGRDSVAINREGRSQQGEIRKRRDVGNTRARDNPDGVGTVAAATPDEGATTMADATETFLTFTDALFAVAGVPTDDRRMLHADIELTMRECPLPLQWQERTGEGHKGSVTVGVIESMKFEDGEVRASGYMLNNDNAAKALDLIQHGVCKPSIDMADATAIAAFADGSEVTEQNFDATVPVYETYKKGTVTAATIVAIPAFGQTGLSMNSDRETRSLTDDAEAALVAAAHDQPVYDPALFEAADPNLIRPMRLTMDPDTGRVFGFIATWKDQHRSVGLGNIRPPRSETSYEHFHTSPGVHLSDGTVLPVGRLTVGIGHAPTRGVSAAAAQAHYDNVSACWAIGRVSEHRLGIFFSGVVAPWADAGKVQMGLASPVSGDWRPIGPNRNLELVAVLSVNTPGFLCKVETDESGSPAAMVASMGVVEQGEPAASSWSLDDIRLVMRDVLDEREAEAARQARLASTAGRALSLLGAPLSPTERMAELLAERDATEVDAFGIRKVRDSGYWGMPVGTPLRKGMKPRGKKAGGPKASATSIARAEKTQRQGRTPRSGQGINSDVARQQRGGDAQSRNAAAKADADKRHAKTNERLDAQSKQLQRAGIGRSKEETQKMLAEVKAGNGKMPKPSTAILSPAMRDTAGSVAKYLPGSEDERWMELNTAIHTPDPADQVKALHAMADRMEKNIDAVLKKGTVSEQGAKQLRSMVAGFKRNIDKKLAALEGSSKKA